MSLLRKRLSQSEPIRWISEPPGGKVSWMVRRGLPIAIWVIICATFAVLIAVANVWQKELPFLAYAGMAGLISIATLSMFYLMSDTEIAVLPDHVVWNDRWLFKKDLPRVRLDSIDLIDVEEAGDTVTLRCGDQSHRLEEVVGGQVEQFALATGRPVRIWRRCNSPSADKARKWNSRTYLTVSLVLIVAAVYFLPGTVDRLFPEAAPKWVQLAAQLIGIGIAVVLAHIASMTLPHLLAGRSMTGSARQEFVCTISDPRWDGVQPDNPQEPRLRLGVFQRWAMRLAYGEAPEYPENEPETIPAAAGDEQG